MDSGAPVPTFFSGSGVLGLWVFGTILFIGLVLLLSWYWYEKKKILQERVEELVMLEVRVPKQSTRGEDEPVKTFKELVGVADQMFTAFAGLKARGLRTFLFGQPVLSFEIVGKNKEIIFYVGVPRQFQEVAEKQILSFFPEAQVEPGQDFRIFDRPNLKAVAGQLQLERQYIFPIRTYLKMDSDPLVNLTNVLSKLGEDSRAVIQVLVQPLTTPRWRAPIDYAIGEVSKGRTVSFAPTWWGRVWHNFTFNILMAAGKKREEVVGAVRLSVAQEEMLKALEEKGSKTGFRAQIRIVTAAPTQQEAEAHLQNIFSAFAQFSAPDLNSFKLVRPVNQKDLISHFILRAFWGYRKLILNSEELASIYHFPSYLIQTPGIRWFLAKRAPAPTNMPTEGIVLGVNLYRGEKTIVRLKHQDRRRHLYAIGMTGTGKSTFFESMILQDIREGRGVAFFDPHGESIENILQRIPKERAEDVILFDPADTQRPMGLNLLEWRTPEEKDFLVAEAIQIFYKLFDPTRQGFVGPQFEHWMRNAALTVMESEGGGTLIEIPRLFVDDEFRKKKIAQVKDEVVRAFWVQQMAKTADFHKSEMYNYFISKFGRFMTNRMMRNIIGQAHSAFDFRQVMDEGKILLVKLSKGKIGELNCNLLGMILVARLFTAALSRHDLPMEKRRDFYLYVDEFQNFATETFASILSEARKYRLNLNITNQFIAQVPEGIRDAIIGNVGTLVAFRIGMPDAEFLAKEFEPIFEPQDLTSIEAFNAYVRLLIDNTPTKPFSMQTIPDSTPPNSKLAAAIGGLSRLKFGKSLAIVEAEVGERTKILEKHQLLGSDSAKK